MSKKSRRAALPLLAVACLGVGIYVAAQTPPVPEKKSITLRKTINKSYGTYTVYFEYEPKRAWAGNDNLELTIRVETTNPKNLKLVKCEWGDRGPVMIDDATPRGGQQVASAEDLLTKSEYRCNVAIKEEAKEDPRDFQINLRFAPPDQDKHPKDDEYSDIVEDFPLSVSVREGGKLIVAATAKQKVERCSTGSEHTFKLPLYNGFREYNANLQKIEVGSSVPGLVERIISTEPAGTIKGTAVFFDPALVIEPSENRTLNITVGIAGMSFDKYIRGFGEDTGVEFAFAYDDGKGRRITDFTHRENLNVLPSIRVLLLSILLGTLAGTLVTVRLGRLQQEGVITRKQKAMFILGTVAVGIVVSFVAMQGEVKFSTLYFNASYDKPFVLFIIGVAATVGGAPMLTRLLGLDTASRNAAQAAPEKRT